MRRYIAVGLALACVLAFTPGCPHRVRSDRGMGDKANRSLEQLNQELDRQHRQDSLNQQDSLGSPGH